VFEIIFYEDKKGFSELLEFITNLDAKAETSKNERIMLKQITFHINILERLGTRAGQPYIKHIQDEIWELRPGSNRILFFSWYQDKIVLLHHFRKTTRKTPKSEIDKAFREMNDWKEREDEHD
jgi:phage-related protein